MSASASFLESNVVSMMQHMTGQSSVMDRHLLALDARMEAIQYMLGCSMNSPQRMAVRPRSECIQTTTSHGASGVAITFKDHERQRFHETEKAAYELVRVVSPALLTYEENGKTCKTLFAIDTKEITKLDAVQRAVQRTKAIQYLQSLRLFMWLFRRDNYLSTNSPRESTIARSALVRQAGFLCAWERAFPRYLPPDLPLLCMSLQLIGRYLEDEHKKRLQLDMIARLRLDMTARICWVFQGIGRDLEDEHKKRLQLDMIARLRLDMTARICWVFQGIGRDLEDELKKRLRLDMIPILSWSLQEIGRYSKR